MSYNIPSYARYIIGAVLALFMANYGVIAMATEQPDYTVSFQQDNIEIRDYHPMLIAQVAVDGDREQAIKQGFKILADYIFGDNISQDKIAMTAPVTQELSEKIAMTAPVMQQEYLSDSTNSTLDSNEQWLVSFVMPKEYTLQTIPQPNNKEIQLLDVPGKKMAAIVFSGRSRTSNIQKHEQLLEDYIQQNNLIVISSPVYAFYNPPWTLPMWRRNEVMVEIE